jgi:hypothetical protein
MSYLKKLLILPATAERITLINIIAEKFKHYSNIDCVAITLHANDTLRLNSSAFTDIIEFNNLIESAHTDVECIDEITAKKIVDRDRYLDINNETLRHCQKFTSDILNLIAKYDFSIGIGEISWAFEELTYRALHLSGFEYITPSSSRFIENSWFLAPPMSESNPISPKTNRIYNDTRVIRNRPDYFLMGISALSIKQRLKNLSPSRILGHIKTKKRFNLFLSKICYFLTTLFPAKSSNYLIRKRGRYDKIILFPLHVQPEASIDYMGYENRDQYKLIHELRLLIPNSYALCVKPHPGSIHELDLLGRLKLHLMDHVYFIESSIDSLNENTLFDHCITVTGTLSGQFAMKGKESYTLETMFFNEHALCKRVCLNNITKIIENKVKSISEHELALENERFISYISNISLDGFNSPLRDGSFDPIFVESLFKEINARLI